MRPQGHDKPIHFREQSAIPERNMEVSHNFFTGGYPLPSVPTVPYMQGMPPGIAPMYAPLSAVLPAYGPPPYLINGWGAPRGPHGHMGLPGQQGPSRPQGPPGVGSPVAPQAAPLNATQVIMDTTKLEHTF